MIRIYKVSDNGTVTVATDCLKAEDFERDIADVVIDHGLMKYHPWQASSTLLNCETLEVVRFGSCYENIADILKRHFKIQLPKAPTAQ
jgi:hypothetical protein